MEAAATADAEIRASLHRRAIRLEQFSVPWMLVEARCGKSSSYATEVGVPRGGIHRETKTASSCRIRRRG